MEVRLKSRLFSLSSFLPGALAILLAACATPPPTVVPEPTPAAPKWATGRPSDTLIPRDVLFGDPARARVTISPDGKHLAWLAPREGVLNVWVAPIDDLSAARAVTQDTTRPVRRYLWAYTSKHLLYLQDKGGDEDFHIYRVSLDTGEVTDLVPLDKVRVEVFGLSSRKPTTLIVGVNDRDARYHDPYRIDLETGARDKIMDNPGYAGFVFDEDLKVRLGLRSRDDGGSDIEALDAKGGAKVIDTIPFSDSLTTEIMGFDASGRKVFLSDSRGRDTAALFAWDLAGNKKALVAENPKADVGSIMQHPTRLTIEAVSFNWDKNRWTVLDKAIAKDLEALAAVHPGEVEVASRSLDDRTWIVVFRDDRQPAVYYRWDRKTRQATRLFSGYPALEGLTLARMHPVVPKSRDGLDLVSYLTLPPAADPDGDGRVERPVPMVLLVHGGPWARDVWGYNPLHQLLANRGYAVLAPNFRGSTGFGKAFVNAADQEWGRQMHDDLLDAVQWAVSQGVTTTAEVCIMGGSYGGYSTLVGLTMTPEVFKCGVDIVGPSSLITLLESIPPYWAPAVSQFKQRVGDWTTPEGRALLTERSPLTHADKIVRPLLIGQGANDPRVKQQESDQLVRVMKERNIPVSYALFPDEGHGFARRENRLAFFGLAEAFLSAHLGGSYEPLTGFVGSSLQIPTGAEGIPGIEGLVDAPR
jgi:dipeptidyl aminopeptidase/acylaminoacyl peptidase